jgi:hypothetical protein
MKPIVIWYHCLFQLEDRIVPEAVEIVSEQMRALTQSGLVDIASEIVVGVNGGEESRIYVESMIPEKASVIYHGLQCKNECRTMTELGEWAQSNPDAYVLYLHAKGAAHPSPLNNRWRNCMMQACVWRWRHCVDLLDHGHDAVGAHWVDWQMMGLPQRYFAGTFFWATSRFLKTLPSIQDSARVRISGIDSPESRYEAEVWIGTGPKLPRIVDLARHRFMSCP